MPAQCRLDLSELDPEATDLYLVVDPTQELDRPVLRDSARGPPSGTGAPPAPGRKRSGTKRSAVSSGRFR